MNAIAIDLFVPTAEAAFIAGISDRDMNRAVDEHILPEALIRLENGRRFARLGAVLAGFYFTSDDVYAAVLRRKVVEELTARVRLRRDLELILALRSEILTAIDWRVTVQGASLGVVSIDLGSFVTNAVTRVREIEKARNLVMSDPEILGGAPVFAGTRVPIDTVVGSLNKGISRRRVLDAYPSLTEEHLEAARVYSGIHPRRGRPIRSSGPPASWKMKSSRRINDRDPGA